MMEANTYVATQRADVLRVKGADRVDLLHRLSTQDLRPLRESGRLRQTLFTTQQGKLVDWTQLYALDGELWLLASAGRVAAVRAWIDKYTIMEDVVTEDISADTHEIAFFGPQAASLAGFDEIPNEGTFIARDGGVWSAGLAAFGPCIRGLVPPAEADRWQKASVARGAILADAATLTWLRLQAGVPSAAYEFREQVNPLELRLTHHAVGWNKGCYIGQEVISRLDSYDKVARVLMGFACDAPLPALPDGETFKVTADGKTLGRVTSWANHGGSALGLALVKREAAHPTAVRLESADAVCIDAQLVARPFFA